MTGMPAPTQCVILVGGLGTRLGAVTASCPKPLLAVGDRPFLDTLLWHAARFGFRKVLLLAGYRADMVVEYAQTTSFRDRLVIEVVAEPQPLGTAGALRAATGKLDDRFILANGDSVFDFNWLDLAGLIAGGPDVLVGMALRALPDATRFGVVDLEGERVEGFRERGDAAGGLVNGGIYLMSRAIVSWLPEIGSLESDVLPALAGRGLVRGRIYDGFFLDIGVPGALAAASTLVPNSLRRPAVFFDRDGVLNVDHGYVADAERFDWISGARSAVKWANDRGYFAFLVTNQAGVARGLYAEQAVRELHAHLQDGLRAEGAHLDDIRYCPHHPQGTVPALARSCLCRKPRPGMILDLLGRWPVDVDASLLVGDKATDIEAGERAGIRSVLFSGGDLREFLAATLSEAHA